jgi:nicotinamidase-related amidase
MNRDTITTTDSPVVVDSFSHVCLLVVDIQKAFYTELPQIAETFPEFKTNVARLLSLCRSLGIEVVHIRAVYNPEQSPWTPYWKVLNPDKKDFVTNEEEDFASALEGEKVVIKHTFDGFLNTELDDYLKQKGIKMTVICGLISSCCVLFTTSGAFLRGYRTLVVEDCCGDRLLERHKCVVQSFYKVDSSN